jgi:hypothetical protein
MDERKYAQLITAEISLPALMHEIDVGDHHFLCLSLQVLAPSGRSKRFPCLDAQKMNVARNPVLLTSSI